MGIIPMLLTIYLVVVVWLPDLNKWTQITVILLMSLSAVILGFLLSRNVVYTILSASSAAKEIAGGDLSKRIEISGDDSEMGEFANSFNQITSKLERKISELEASEEKFRHLVENVPDLLYYLDPVGNITSINDEVTELLGYEKSELLNRPFAEFVHPEDYEDYELILRERRVDQSRLTKGLRIRFKKKNGEYDVFEINSRGIYEKDGSFVGTEGLARDISAQLAMESEREEFLYMLTHDIKNPISAILFIIYMMRDGTISANKFHEYYDKIENACNGVVRLVEDFLEYKKFELGIVYLEPSKVNLHRMLVDIARTYNSEATAKGKCITINGENCDNGPSAERVIMEVDERYIQRVIENLVTNAIKFAETRVDLLCVETEDAITLSVNDDGPGVSEKEKDNIFNLFHTSGGPRTSKGIGVGLASVQKIVVAHGGQLTVGRKNNSGCSFNIRLPKQPAKFEADPQTEPMSEVV
jgi:two-component system phosphate regulon sensor histidine kinase PhoR